MAPIKVGLIGLSGAPPDKYEGVSWTPSAHLPYLLASPHYEIVALLNTSISSGKVAAARYNLPESTKTYENPEGKPISAYVDLVVCSVRVDSHFNTVKPSLEAGKAVFVEWPLDKNVHLAKEMSSLASKHDCRTIVGLQASYDPVLRLLKKTIEEGRIGKVLGSSIWGSQGNGGETEVKNVRYFLDREVGGNLVILGEFEPGWQSLMSNRHEFKDIIDPAKGGEVVEKGKRNTVPDQIMFQATTEKDDSPVSIHLRGGATFPGTPAFEWRIQGSKGELRLTSSSANLNLGRPDMKVQTWDKGTGVVGRPGTKVELWDQGTGNVEVLEPEEDEWDANEEKGFVFAVGNIARLYEAYRKGEWIPDFEWGVKRHQLIEDMWQAFDEAEAKKV
ncbi:related to transcription co-repressor GAL80 [Phialocephala subalpina]|uniref:Related to transcription co-repressor GAL80 n=1 Tax=Phialocephala subalpina TaxID=576137 RepID=A0A1L7XRE8_9HELO|nr:related to transcription co-repressor GAL80 [Phialocephala subalpina]